MAQSVLEKRKYTCEDYLKTLVSINSRYNWFKGKVYEEASSMRLQLTIEVWKNGNWYLARAPQLDFTSQGKKHDEAKIF